MLLQKLAMLGFPLTGKLASSLTPLCHGGCMCTSWELPPVELLKSQSGVT